jgi:hypothetical protein
MPRGMTLLFVAMSALLANRAGAQTLNCQVETSNANSTFHSLEIAGLAQPLVVLCMLQPGPAGQTPKTANIEFDLNAPITSRNSGGISEVTLVTGNPAPAQQVLCSTATCPAGANVFSGVMNGPQSAQFQNIPLVPGVAGQTRGSSITSAWM